MTREKVGRIIDYSKDLGLPLSIVFIKEHINFDNIKDVWVCNDDDLMLYDDFIKRWITITITNIAYRNT